MSVYEKLSTLGIALPEITPAVAAYVPYVRIGDLVFTSGHVARRDGKPWAGQLGSNLETAEGQEAAKWVAIDVLGTLQAAIGDLNKIKRIVRLLVLVNSAPTFTEQHLVANGASELFQAVFGAAGVHARSAFGAAQIPFGSCVEVEVTAQVE
jgi:enamine deaminase RidA (YjgF/YER057c/UK114 family)